MTKPNYTVQQFRFPSAVAGYEEEGKDSHA